MGAGVPAASVLASVLCILLIGPLLVALCTGGGAGMGNRLSFSQWVFSMYVRLGRLRNLACGACDRSCKRYPLANTCQVPFFASLSDVFTFVFGYKAEGLFLEIGAYDGESFSNTSGLADMGWRGHYIEPIPAYADAARVRHAGNAGRVLVHTTCVGETDGETVEISAAGPFSSAVADEIKSVTASKLNDALAVLGWAHRAEAERIKAVTVSLNTFCRKQTFAPGEIDVMVRARVRSAKAWSEKCEREAAPSALNPLPPNFPTPRSSMSKALNSLSFAHLTSINGHRSSSLSKFKICKHAIA